MAYVITSECVKCGVCLDSCPVSAIIEGDEKFIITSACLDCGECAKVCPLEAIKKTK